MSLPAALRSRAVALLVAVLAAGVSLRYVVVTLAGRIAAHGSAAHGPSDLVDFRDATWLPVRWMLSGRDPYDVVTYSEQHPYAQAFTLYTPAHLTLWSPLGALPYPVAQVLVTLLSAAAVMTYGAATGRHTLRVLRPWASDTDRLLAAGLGVLAAWAFRALAVGFGFGQPSVLYTAAAAAALLGWGGPQGRPVLVALALLKPQTGLPVLLALLVLGRRHDALRGLGLVALGSVPAIVLVSGPAGGPLRWLWRLPTAVRQVLDSPDAGAGVTGRLDLGSVTGRPATALVLLVCAAAYAPLLLLARRRADRRAPVALLLAAGALLAFPHWDYDALWLLAPLALTAAAPRALRDPVLVAGLGLLAAVGLCPGPVLVRLGLVDDPATVARPLLLLGVVCLALALLRTAHRDPERLAQRAPAEARA